MNKKQKGILERIEARIVKLEVWLVEAKDIKSTFLAELDAEASQPENWQLPSVATLPTQSTNASLGNYAPQNQQQDVQQAPQSTTAPLPVPQGQERA